VKVAFLIVALSLALAPGAPAQPAPFGGATAVSATSVEAAGAAYTIAAQPADDAAAAFSPDPSTYLLLALGLFGMGLVSRRRQAE